MGYKLTGTGRVWLVVTALCGWFSLAGQFYLNLRSGVAPLPEIIIRYFSYFTLTTNLLVAGYCTVILLGKPDTRLKRFFSRLSTVTAITFYIVIVGVVYNIILRPLWKPEGFQQLVNELLHSVVPLLFLLYWLLSVPRTGLPYKAVLPWMLYPLIYIVFVLIRGAFSGFYPYPFIDVGKLGSSRVLLNAVLFTGAFFMLSFLFVWVSNLRSSPEIRKAG
jgi:hypothetical protein